MPTERTNPQSIIRVLNRMEKYLTHWKVMLEGYVLTDNQRERVKKNIEDTETIIRAVSMLKEWDKI